MANGRPFEPGREKTGGRQKNTPNNTTSFVRERIVMLWQNRYDEFNADLDSLDPKDRCKIMVELLQYVMPKLASVEYQDKDKPRSLKDELDDLSGELMRE